MQRRLAILVERHVKERHVYIHAGRYAEVDKHVRRNEGSGEETTPHTYWSKKAPVYARSYSQFRLSHPHSSFLRKQESRAAWSHIISRFQLSLE